jgi:hypothetical protein
MASHNIANIVVERTFTVVGGKPSVIAVKIGNPKKLSGHDDYKCENQICGLKNNNIKHACGIDSLQALMLALERVGAEIYTYQDHKDGRLRWAGDESGLLGLPIPNNIEDIIDNCSSH